VGEIPHLWVVGGLAWRAGGLRVRSAVAAAFLAERDRWSLWLPVILGMGIGVYFSAPSEPAVGTGVVALGLVVGAMVALRWRSGVLLGMAALATAAGGFTLSQWAAQRNAGPVVEKQTAPVTVRGRVAAVEVVGGAQRVELDHLAIDRLAATPRKIRLRLTREAAEVVPGQQVKLRAVLRSPPAPSLPGGFDFARQAWFEGLGAVGFAISAPETEAAPPGGPGEAFAEWLAALRHRVTLRMVNVIGGEDGAVAAALVTGERAAVSEKTWDDYRDSGLAHLLSISGVHFSMVAGLVFALVRGSLAAVPGVALRYPIKKWTAVIALAAALFYLLLSGVSVPAQRSFASIAIVLLAVLVDRKAISLRTVAWAATAVLVWQPQALVGASFQMSFAAVIALIAAFEAIGPKLAEWKSEPGAVRWLALYGGGIAFTSVVASAATTFYTIYHFSRFSTWSVASNLLAVPLTGVVVMPAALAALLLMPFGLDEPALVVMGWGVEGINRLAAAVAGWPGASVVVPPVSVGAVVAYSLGGLWLCLWRRRWRLLGLGPMVAALLTIPFHDWPDLLVDGEGQMMAVRSAGGGLLYNSLSRGAFVRSAWEERAGNGRPPREFSAADASDRLACDSTGCLWRGRGVAVALVTRAEALQDDCAVAEVVVAAVPLRHPCPSAAIVIDRNRLWREGPHAVWLTERKAVSVRSWRGERPWVIRPEKR
jgi:competence protein ComEC